MISGHKIEWSGAKTIVENEMNEGHVRFFVEVRRRQRLAFGTLNPAYWWFEAPKPNSLLGFSEV